MHQITPSVHAGLPTEPVEDAAHQARIEAAQNTANEAARRCSKSDFRVEVVPDYVYPKHSPFAGQARYEVTIHIVHARSYCENGEQQVIESIIEQVNWLKNR